MKRNWKRVCAVMTALAMCVNTPNLTVVAEENASIPTTTTVSNGDSVQERYMLPLVCRKRI